MRRFTLISSMRFFLFFFISIVFAKIEMWSLCEVETQWCFGPMKSETDLPTNLYETLVGSIGLADVTYSSCTSTQSAYKLAVDMTNARVFVINDAENCSLDSISSFSIVNYYFNNFKDVGSSPFGINGTSDVFNLGDNTVSFFVLFHNRLEMKFRPPIPVGFSFCECGSPSWCYGPITESNLHHIRDKDFGKPDSDWSYINMVSYPSPNRYCGVTGHISGPKDIEGGIVYHPRITRSIVDLFYHFDVNSEESSTADSLNCRGNVAQYITWTDEVEEQKKKITYGHGRCMNIGSSQVPNYKALVWHGEQLIPTERRGK